MPPPPKQLPGPLEVPDKQTFVQGLDILSQCNICFKPFDRHSHVAVRTACQHVFGKGCLNKWINSSQENSNRCPQCRAVLFTKALKVPKFSNSRTTMIIKVSEAFNVLQRLWARMNACKHHPVIYDTDLESEIQTIVYETIWPRDIHECILSHKMPAMVDLTKDIIRVICEDPRKETLHYQDCVDEWFPRLGIAAGWLIEPWADAVEVMADRQDNLLAMVNNEGEDELAEDEGDEDQEPNESNMEIDSETEQDTDSDSST